MQVDRNLMLHLPRLTVLVTVVADRPGAWFPGPLGPYLTRFPAICLSRDFKRAKVPGTPMKSPFCFDVFWGVILKNIYIFARRQPNHVKHLLNGLYSLLKYNLSEFNAEPAATDRSRHHRSRSTWGLVSRSIGSISSLVSRHIA
jgi:hypothetical protein